MEKHTAYTFSKNEEQILAEALAMYASYMRNIVEPNLIGDESDFTALQIESSKSQDMARLLIEEAEDKRWEELSAEFQEMANRPMDLSDYSRYDWYEHDS